MVKNDLSGNEVDVVPVMVLLAAAHIITDAQLVVVSHIPVVILELREIPCDTSFLVRSLPQPHFALTHRSVLPALSAVVQATYNHASACPVKGHLPMLADRRAAKLHRRIQMILE